MAAVQVFSIAEVLEQILAEIPCNELLLSQRVCRTWQATIQGSKLLKRALFLEPVQPPKNGIIPLHSRAELKQFKRKFTLEYILAKIGPDPEDSESDTSDSDTYGSDLYESDSDASLSEVYTRVREARWVEAGSRLTPSTPKYIIIQNPMMSKVFRSEAEARLKRGLFSPARAQRLAALRAALDHPKASWRKMLWSQPPVKRINLGVHMSSRQGRPVPSEDPWLPATLSYGKPYRRILTGSIKSATGIKLQDLYDEYCSVKARDSFMSDFSIDGARPCWVPKMAASLAKSLPQNIEDYLMFTAEGKKSALYRKLNS